MNSGTCKWQVGVYTWVKSDNCNTDIALLIQRHFDTEPLKKWQTLKKKILLFCDTWLVGKYKRVPFNFCWHTLMRVLKSSSIEPPSLRYNQGQKSLFFVNCEIELLLGIRPHLKMEFPQWGCKGGQSATPDSEKFDKNRGKEGKIRKHWEERGKIGKKRQNLEGSFTLPLLTDRAGYTTEFPPPNPCLNVALNSGLTVWINIENGGGKSLMNMPEWSNIFCPDCSLPVLCMQLTLSTWRISQSEELETF